MTKLSSIASVTLVSNGRRVASPALKPIPGPTRRFHRRVSRPPSEGYSHTGAFDRQPVHCSGLHAIATRCSDAGDGEPMTRRLLGYGGAIFEPAADRDLAFQHHLPADAVPEGLPWKQLSELLTIRPGQPGGIGNQITVGGHPRRWGRRWRPRISQGSFFSGRRFDRRDNFARTVETEHQQRPCSHNGAEQGHPSQHLRETPPPPSRGGLAIVAIGLAFHG